GNLNSYVSDITAIKSQEEAVKLTVVKDTVDVDNQEGFAGYYVTMDGNKIASITRITGTESLVVDTDAVEYKGDTAFVHLNAAGGFNYEAFFTESGRSYYINSLQPTQEDYKVALAKTVPGYVSSLMVSLIKFIIYLPVIIWFLIIEFFEIKRLKDKKRLSFSIGLVLYLIIKVLTFNTYYTPLSISQMPPLLLFTGAKYIFAIGMALVSLLIQKLMKKHNPEMGLITEFIIFALIDIEFTNLLFATYMTA
ncbi:MAG: hypothetical protein K0Q99_1771, partial [Clostridia bacterium]|nr:hypothetical protein [Clostridia bacterium]